jgi:hypothetical protein
MSSPVTFAGFCVGGYNWPAPELPPGASREDELSVRRRLAADDARLTRRLGGNLLRSFWSMEGVISGDRSALTAVLNSLGDPELRHTSVFARPHEERIERLDVADRTLDQLLAAAGGDPSGPFALDFDVLDAVLGGVEDVNRESGQPIRVLLALVSLPPRFMLEAPPASELQAAGRTYDFASLWDRYVRLHQLVHRQLVTRYAVERPLTGLYALEIVNEPDYMWVPEEVKIEWGGDGLLNPVGKYVTELHLSQVPSSDAPFAPFERVPWGFRVQTGPWLAERPEAQTPVLEFDWGSKFDWYVRTFAHLMRDVAWAVKDEAAARGVEVVTVSGSVTHNNLDYLLRLHRADPAAFRWIDKIGLHPYHWVRNDVWDDHFVSGEPIAGWSKRDPRTFAGELFKRFDFLRAFSERSGDRRLDRELRDAFGDRKLWITEFGIGSKVLGEFNAAVADSTRFIRPRGLVGATAGYDDVVWEDLWTAFLDQIDRSWLADHRVECVLLYALRELGMSGFDLDDEDRSNLALFHRDARPRIAPAVAGRIASLLAGISGQDPADEFASPQPPDAAPVPPELYRRPWRATTLSTAEEQVMTMLSTEERQLLHWLTGSYYSARGAIVDGGCFVGGSTVPLAEGLLASGHPGSIDVYDLFEVEAYMTDFYFKGEDLQAGDSFRRLFDRNTEHVSEVLNVHEGDLTAEGWRGDPIEILFIDFAKAWALNDFIVQSFFPALVPGRSIVIQQDFVYAGCPWVILTMEELSDYFEPVAFAEYSSVVYLCTRDVPADLPAISALPHARRMELMDRSIGRFRGYARQELRCAKATLLVEHGDRDEAESILDLVERESGDHFAVAPALALVRSLL